MKEKIIKIIAEKGNLNIEDIKPDCSFKDLGFDSLDTVELIMEFENEFLIHVSDDEMEKLETVGQAIKFIEDRK